MKAFAASVVFALCIVSIATADEFNAYITKVEGNVVFFKKSGKKGSVEEKAEIILGAKICKGEIYYDEGDFKAQKKTRPDKAPIKGPKYVIKGGDLIEGGLRNEVFTKLGNDVLIVGLSTNADGKIFEMKVVGVNMGKKK